MEIKIKIEKQLDLEQEKRLLDYLYFKLIEDPSLNRFSVRSDNFFKEIKWKHIGKKEGLMKKKRRR